MLSRQSYFIKSFDGGLQCEFNQTFIATLRSQICVLFTTKIPIMNGFLPKNVLVTTIQDTYSVRSKTLHCYEMNQCTMFISLSCPQCSLLFKKILFKFNNFKIFMKLLFYKMKYFLATISSGGTSVGIAA